MKSPWQGIAANGRKQLRKAMRSKARERLIEEDKRDGKGGGLLNRWIRGMLMRIRARKIAKQDCPDDALY